MPRGGKRAGSGAKPGVKRGPYLKVKLKKEFQAVDVTHLGPKVLKFLEDLIAFAGDEEQDLMERIKVRKWLLTEYKDVFFAKAQAPAGAGGAGALHLHLTMPDKEDIPEQRLLEDAEAEVVGVIHALPPKEEVASGTESST